MMHKETFAVHELQPGPRSLGEMARMAIAGRQATADRDATVEALVKRMEHHIQTRSTPVEVFSIPNGEVPDDIFRAAVQIICSRHGVNASRRTTGNGNFIAMFHPPR